MIDLKNILLEMLSTFDNYDVSVDETPNSFHLKVTPKVQKESFDNSEILKRVKEFENNIQRLDDDLFNEIIEDAGQHVDLNEFDELCRKESHTEAEAQLLDYMISYMYNEILQHIDNKIDELKSLRCNIAG